MIKLQVIGNLGKDAVVKEVGGKNVINFSVCHSESYKNAQGEKVDKSAWVECDYWTDKTAVAPYLKKGTKVYVEGQPMAQAWKDAQGEAKATLRLRIFSVELLGAAQGGEASTATPTATQTATTATQQVADDLPF